QCHGRRVRRELAAPLDLDRTELSYCQGTSTSVPLKTGSSIFSRLLSVFFLKRGVFGDFLEVVIANDPGSCFVREIFSAIVNLSVELRYFAFGFCAIGRSFSLLGQSTLQSREPRFVLRRVTRIAYSRSIRKGHGAID